MVWEIRTERRKGIGGGGGGGGGDLMLTQISILTFEVLFSCW